MSNDNLLNNVPIIGANVDDTKKLLELYAKLVMLIVEFDSKLNAISVDIAPIRSLKDAIESALSDAGIELTDVNSMLFKEFDGLKKSNDLWNAEFKVLLDSLKDLKKYLFAIIVSMLVAIGVGIFNFVGQKGEYKNIQDQIALVLKNQNTIIQQTSGEDWKYDSNRKLFYTVSGADTLFSTKPLK